MYDAIVIGGGAAGLSAAVWLARYRRKVLLLDAAEPRNRWSRQSHGYLGLDPANPADLLALGRSALARYDTAETRFAAATRAARDEEGRFSVRVGDERLVARRLVLATGVKDEFPDVDGFFDHYGISVFHCPTCDGYESEGAQVGVLGWSEDSVGFALDLLNWAKEVIVVTDGRRFEGDSRHRRALDTNGIKIIEDEAVELLGPPGRLQGIRLRSNDVVPCQFAFFTIEHHPGSDLPAQLGCAMTDEGCVEVDSECETSVPGVYAAGDMTPGIQLVQIAAAGGATAGVACALSFYGEEVASDAPSPAPDPAREVRPKADETDRLEVH